MAEPTASPPAFTVDFDEGTVRLRVTGDLDMAAEPGLLAVVETAINVPLAKVVVLDVTEVTFIDPAGARGLQRARSMLAASSLGFKLSVANDGPVPRLLSLTNAFDDLDLRISGGE